MLRVTQKKIAFEFVSDQCERTLTVVKDNETSTGMTV